MARHCIREPRYIPPVQRIGEQPDLFGGPTLSHVAERKGPPKGWQRQLQKWGRCTVIADLEAAPLPAIEPAPPPPPIFLVACVAAKLDRPAPARDLYISPWFQKARAYVERQGGPWFILSAKHGLIAPETVIAPYDETLCAMKASARRLWGARVIEAMADQIDAAAPLIVLAGRHYRDPLCGRKSSGARPRRWKGLGSASNSLGSLKNGDGVQLAVRRFDTLNQPVIMNGPSEPLWTQDQAIAYEAALEAINDVIAGYSEQIALEQDRQKPDAARISWLEMRTDHASATSHALTVTDDENVRQALLEYSAMVRAREAPR